MTQYYVNGGKTVGRSHLHDNTPCQDSIQSITKNGVTVIALSDGCGSEPFSETGSSITVKTICDLYSERFDEFYEMEVQAQRYAVVGAIIDGIKEYVNNNPKLIQEFNKKEPEHYKKFINSFPTCKQPEKVYPITLFNATVQYVAVKGEKAIIGRLGDGIIAAVKNKSLVLLSSEDKLAGINQEYSNGTYYPTTAILLPAWNQFEIIKSDSFSDYSMAFIVSDGVADVLCGSENNDTERFIFPDEVENILKNANDLTRFLETQYKPLKGIYDDLSIIELHCPAVEIQSITIREYDENGRTIENTKLHELKESSITFSSTSAVESRELKNDEKPIILPSGEEDYVEPEDYFKEVKVLLEKLEKSMPEHSLDKFKKYFEIKDSEYMYFCLSKALIVQDELKKNQEMHISPIPEIIAHSMPYADEDDWELLIQTFSIYEIFTVDMKAGIIKQRK